jgi:hypothetical protein
MKHLLAAVLIAFAVIAQPAAAQTSTERQQVQQVQAMLADLGRWNQEYMAALSAGSQPLTEIQNYLNILERFSAGELRQAQARREIEAWRTQSLALVQQSRVAAEALRPPPSLAILGPDGVTLERALHSARDSAPSLVAEFERIVNACADLGLEALSDASKGLEARQRTLLNAQRQLVRVDLNRVNITTASVSPTHPTHHLSVATEHYYAQMLVVAEHGLEAIEGRGDRAALVASMRGSARDMRASLDRSTALTEQMRAQLRSQLGGPAVEIARAGLLVFETYPATIQAYAQLAENVDRAATAIERGEDVLVVWGDQEEWDMPYLNEIARLDQVRAQLLADNAGTL